MFHRESRLILITWSSLARSDTFTHPQAVRRGSSDGDGLNRSQLSPGIFQTQVKK